MSSANSQDILAVGGKVASVIKRAVSSCRAGGLPNEPCEPAGDVQVIGHLDWRCRRGLREGGSERLGAEVGRR